MIIKTVMGRSDQQKAKYIDLKCIFVENGAKTSRTEAKTGQTVVKCPNEPKCK